MKPTPSDIEGPFYKEGAPFRSKLVDNPSLTVKGAIYNTDGEFVKNAVIDYWHADKQGVYYMESFDFRGKISVIDAHYEFQTIIPGDYQIEDHEFRCAHIHIKVSAPEYKLLTTQLYFPDDPYNKTDRWFDPCRVINHPKGIFDFVLEKLVG